MTEHAPRIAYLHDELKHKLLRHLKRPCICPTAIPGFHLARRDQTGAPESCFEKPMVGLVIQGTKHSLMGGREYIYTENQSIVAGVDMPISSYVMHATPEKPFLFLYLYLDTQYLSSLSMEIKQDFPENIQSDTSISITDTNEDILEMFLRMLELLEKSKQIALRAPMMLHELHYLLLISPHGNILRQLNMPGTQNHQIVQAIRWIRKNYKIPMRIDELARQVNMSTANLHRRFKMLTGLSPLQYQKQLRLHEAQRLMLVENERASSAALSVGYGSVTQFTREYKRIFGEPPLRDRKRRRSPGT
ncbi:MAG: AraC family transcriptional regulator [Desulfovibrionaceae bacterium]|nr:AraC family transcriptional regulator [Desulfovibrionaceae bacterium]